MTVKAKINIDTTVLTISKTTNVLPLPIALIACKCAICIGLRSHMKQYNITYCIQPFHFSVRRNGTNELATAAKANNVGKIKKELT